MEITFVVTVGSCEPIGAESLRGDNFAFFAERASRAGVQAVRLRDSPLTISMEVTVFGLNAVLFVQQTVERHFLGSNTHWAINCSQVSKESLLRVLAAWCQLARTMEKLRVIMPTPRG